MEHEVVVNPPTDTPDENGWYPDRTRRVAILWIGEQSMLEACISFFMGKRENEYELRLTTQNELFTKDLKVVRVSHSWDRSSFGILLSHPKFGSVLEGCEPPDVDNPLKSKFVWEWIPVKNESK